MFAFNTRHKRDVLLKNVHVERLRRGLGWKRERAEVTPKVQIYGHVIFSFLLCVHPTTTTTSREKYLRASTAFNRFFLSLSDLGGYWGEKLSGLNQHNQELNFIVLYFTFFLIGGMNLIKSPIPPARPPLSLFIFFHEQKKLKEELIELCKEGGDFYTTADVVAYQHDERDVSFGVLPFLFPFPIVCTSRCNIFFRRAISGKGGKTKVVTDE